VEVVVSVQANVNVIVIVKKNANLKKIMIVDVGVKNKPKISNKKPYLKYGFLFIFT